jgi:hypothetical protein
MNAPLRHGHGSLPTTAPLASSTDLRLRACAPRIHNLGEAPLYYLLRELATGAPLLPTVERYARLPADLIRAYAGDKLMPALTPIRSSRRG